MIIPKNVLEAVKEIDRDRQMREFEATMKKAVAFKQAVAMPIEGLTPDMAHAISRNSKDIKLWAVLNAAGKPSGYFVIFNIAEIHGREDLASIRIDVPSGKGGLVAGPGKCNIKDMLCFPFLQRLHINWINIVCAGA